MAGCFRIKYGDGRESAKWYLQITDGNGTRRRLPAFTSKKASESLGRQIERLISCTVSGEPLPTELTRWLEELPKAISEKLGAWGMLSAARVTAGKTLLEHVKDWHSYLDSKGRSAKHLLHCRRHVERLAESERLTYWHEFTATAVVNFLSKLKTDDSSARTRNSVLCSAKAFSRWMNADGRANADPLAYLKSADTRTDKRHVRRALSPDEIGWLLDTTEGEPERHGLTGSERSLLYRLCIESGLRASEAASLTRESFDLDGKPPVVVVPASLTKNRQLATLPLKESTAATLTPFLDVLLPRVRLFRMHKYPKYAAMLQADLAAARQQWLAEAGTDAAERKRRDESDFLLDEDSAGRVIDFHSLRHTTGTLLAAVGTHPRIAQSLMRHSTVDLTMSLYTHPYAEQQSDAISKLPDFATPKKSRAKKTGTV